MDEVAQDAGGLMREWITELTKSLFSEETGIFKQIKTNSKLAYFPSSNSRYMYPSEYKDYFRFTGQVFAKALFEKIPVMVNLNKTLLKLLVGQRPKDVSIEDLKDYDMQIYQSIKFMAEDPSIDLDYEDFRFTIMKNDGKEVDLIKDGSNIKVTNENRSDYGKRVARYYLLKEVK